jgi:arylsulfatase A-like enzyme
MRKVLAIALLSFFACYRGKLQTDTEVAGAKPNIVYVLADDLGYGDVSCYNPQGRIQTPNIDRLAAQGMRFTDAHAPSSVCTPTRYALLTGEYAWRSRLPVGVLRGYGRSLIPADSFTVSTFLRAQGYHTAVVGKWHLGLDWSINPGHEAALQPGSYGVRENGMVTDMESGHIDFTTPPSGGPLSRGFDESFILPASLDMEPYCFLKNDTLTELPDGYTQGNDLNTGYTGAFWRAGKMSPSFEFDQVLNHFSNRATAWLAERSTSRQPFFLYLPLSGPHTPWVPTTDFAEKSAAGTYGDFVQMVDHVVGEILKTLDSLNMEDNTIVIFASDNGPFWRPAFADRFDHRAAGPWRGMKGDVYEGGHRIPFIVRWPGKVPPESVSEAPTTLTNLAATCADILGVSLKRGEARDSYSIVPVLLHGADTVPGQTAIVHHSSHGHFAVRQGSWKLIDRPGSGGFTEPVFTEPGPNVPKGQLYNLADDPGETTNLYDRFPEKVRELEKLLGAILE